MAKVVGAAAEKDRHREDIEKIVLHGDCLYSGSYDGSVKMWTRDLRLVHSWQAHDFPVYSLAADDHRLFTSSCGGEIKEWDSKTGAFRQMTVLLGSLGGEESSESPETVNANEWFSQTPINRNDQASDVKALTLNNGWLLAGDHKGTLMRYGPDFVRNREKQTYTEIWGVAASADGDTVYTARDNAVLIFDVGQDYAADMYKTTVCVAASLEGRAPVVVDGDSVACVDRRSGMNVVVYVTTDGGKKFEQKAVLKGHDMIVNALLLRGAVVCSSGWDGRVKLWDAASGEQKASVELGAGNYVNSLAWDADAGVVYAAGKDGMLVKIQF